MHPLNPVVIVSKSVVFLYTASFKFPPKDRLSSTIWWRRLVRYQVRLTQNQQYDVGLFGDSMTSPLKNSLGRDTFNFAITAMSTRSLVEQLEILVNSQVKLQTAIVAIGTNDAWYDIDDTTFVELIKQAADLLRLMGSQQIILLPAFYSSAAAANNPFRAGTVARIEEINQLLHQVAVTEKLYFANREMQVLFENQVLKVNYTTDGVHLNASGLERYRQILLKLIDTR